MGYGSWRAGAGRRQRRARQWTVGVGVGTLVLVGAACAGGSGASAPSTTPTSRVATARLQSAAVDTGAADSVGVSVSATGVTDGTSSTLVTGSGAFDLTRDVGQMTLSSPALTTALGTSSGGSVSVLSDGTDLYANVPALADLRSGKTWIEAPISAADPGAGSLASGALGDPTQILALLAQYGGPVTTVGPATVGGTATTEYRADISLGRVAAAAGTAAHRSAAHRFGTADRQGLEKLGITTVPVTVWVGTDGRLRQAQVTVDLTHAQLPAAGSTAAGAAALPVITETFGFTGYGQPVTVTPPPASQVVSLSQVLSSLKGILPAGGLPGVTGSATS